MTVTTTEISPTEVEAVLEVLDGRETDEALYLANFIRLVQSHDCYEPDRPIILGGLSDAVLQELAEVRSLAEIPEADEAWFEKAELVMPAKSMAEILAHPESAHIDFDPPRFGGELVLPKGHPLLHLAGEMADAGALVLDAFDAAQELAQLKDANPELEALRTAVANFTAWQLK